jgi:hypothetical protein
MRFRLPGVLDNRHMNVVRLLALSSSHLYSQEINMELVSVGG